LTGAAYVAAYVALDWVSYLHPVAELAITPWNPPPGLSLFLLLRFGLRYVPLLFVAALAADFVVRGVTAHPALTIASSLVLASGYALVGWVLIRALGMGRSLVALRDVNLLVAAAVVGPFAIALAYVGLHCAFGMLPMADFADAAIQFWIGDAIGIVVTTPLLLEYAARPLRWRPRFDALLLFEAAAVAAALWIVFGIKETDEFKYFYLLFLPLIAIAMRQGYRGAIVASLAIQLVLIVASETIGAASFVLRELQFLMLALALTALYLGMAVTERAAAQRAVAARDAALQRALRMASAGEMAAAIAHELNQPLSAIGTYVRACVLMLERPAPDPLLRDTLERVSREVSRAGAVVKRLREFYRTGSSQRERVAPAVLVDAALESLRPRLAQTGIDVEIDCPPGLPRVYVDRVQLQAVLHNLVANAIDSLATMDGDVRRIRIAAAAVDGSFVRIAVADNGPGLAAEAAPRLFEPFNSTKPDGMGLGLAMSRSIVEAHGGRLALAPVPTRGAQFEVLLPIGDDDDAQR
jgi:signal transduction histidine kinase